MNGDPNHSEPRLFPATEARLILFALAFFWFPSQAEAQLDPEPRQLFQLGYSRQPDGRGPFAGYAYYYLNQPRFWHERQTLRLVLAPGYVDSEFGFRQALGPSTDLGLGLAGGGFADSYSEIRRGQYIDGESFLGNGAKAALGIYQHFPDVGPVPLFGILRAEGRYSTFNSRGGTDPAFLVPPNQPELVSRAGMRLGGVEPVMVPTMAAEWSAWYEGHFRTNPETYGYSGDREIVPQSHLYWTRALLVFNRPKSDRRFIALLTAGASARADRFTAYRLGGNLPMGSEFPLPIPGFYYQEISARRFVLAGGSYLIPLCRDGNSWVARLNGDTALVDYLPSQEQRGRSRSGVGAGLAWQSPKRAWQLVGEYGYGIDALRPGGRGAHEIGVFAQFDFRRAAVPFFHPIVPQRGLQELLRGNLP